MKERDIIKAIKKFCDNHNIFYIRNVGSKYQMVGLPDFVLCVKGFFIAIECKTTGKKPTGLQVKVLESIVNSGGRSFVVDDEETLNNVLKELLQYENINSK